MKSGPAGTARQGLTLIEVLVSICILVVILVALHGLQVSSLRSSQDAAISQQASALVRDQLDALRAAGLTQMATTCNPQQPLQRDHLKLTCTPTPCKVIAQTLNCTASSVPADAYQVQFVVRRAGKTLLETQTVVSQ